MAKRFNEESSIGDVLKQFISQNKLEAGMDVVNVRDAWKNLMGNGVNNYTTEIQRLIIYIQILLPFLLVFQLNVVLLFLFHIHLLLQSS